MYQKYFHHNKIKFYLHFLLKEFFSRRMSFWQAMPVYWNADRASYLPAPPVPMHMEL
jgi:hypothetical protein